MKTTLLLLGIALCVTCVALIIYFNGDYPPFLWVMYPVGWVCMLGSTKIKSK